jgi:hypothetical protein
MVPPVTTAALAARCSVRRDNRTCLLAQRATALQPSKKTPVARIIPLCHPSPPGATLIAERPSSPSKLTPAQAMDVVRTVFTLFRLTINITGAAPVMFEM